MPRDLGPDMLRNLDEQLASGNIDKARYEARKVEVLELIRRGKAIEYSRSERTWMGIQGLLAIIAGVFCIASLGILGLIGGIALIAWGVWRTRKIR